MNHYIEICKICKTVVSQCRCPSPNKDKRETVCDKCRCLLDEIEKLQSAIMAFCKGQKWADESWKKQPHIKPLFDITAALRQGGSDEC